MSEPSIRTSSFTHGKDIPEKFTKDGADVSPELTNADIPDEAVSLAIVIDDPDAPDTTFTHWSLWNLPPDTVEIPADVPTTETVSTLGDAIQGRNDFGDVGYGGPRPPTEHGPHEYQFHLYVVDEMLDLSPGAPKRELDDALDGHVIAEDRFTGLYERS